jgi:hypothetical protein
MSVREMVKRKFSEKIYLMIFKQVAESLTTFFAFSEFFDRVTVILNSTGTKKMESGFVNCD